MRLECFSGSIIRVKVDFDVAAMKVDFNVIRVFAWRSCWIFNWNPSSDGLSVFAISPVVKGRIMLLIFFVLYLADPIRIVSEHAI